MYQSVNQIEKSIKDRNGVDVPLTNFWLYILLLNFLTLGIYGIIMFFKQIGRIDKFIQRKRPYYQAVADIAERKMIELNKDESLISEARDLKKFYEEQFWKNKEINAGLTLLLTLVTFGLWGFVRLYKQNKAGNELQLFEAEFDERLSRIWMKAEIIKYPISFTVNPQKNRNFPLYLGLSLITFGVWALVWEYKLHTDPDTLYSGFHSAEDMVLQTVRA